MALGKIKFKVSIKYKWLLYVSVYLFKYVPDCCIELLRVDNAA